MSDALYKYLIINLIVILRFFFNNMPLNSSTKGDLLKEYLSQLTTYQIQQADACHAYGSDSEEEEEYIIKIYKLSLEFKKRVKEIN